VTRAAFSRVLNEHVAISPEMALRLEGWLGVENDGRADLWLGQQAAYDLWQARQAGAPKVQRAEPLAAQAILSPPLIPPP
jgi:plasmid maintenance system antidote protein VapI